MNMAKEETIPNNDKIVEDIVNDFKESCKTDVELSHSFKTGEDEPSSESIPGSSKTPEVDELVEEDNSDLKKKRLDYVDEDEMKEKELSYSDEDREKYKKEADEHKQKGNNHFKANEFEESVECYTLGLRTCPLSYSKDRAILYANRAACKIKLGDDELALDDCNKAIELDPNYIRVLLRRAQLQESMDRLDESLEDYKKLLELDPSCRDAVIACQRLPPLINERNEKMKTEMLGKLKDLGNVFLRPFGLSTDNFKMVQDPNTGGYSVSFQQNS